MADAAQRTVVVTGGSTGIGEAITRGLLSAGDRVVNISLHAPTFEADGLTTIIADLADRTTLDHVAEQIAAAGATAFVHNAGVIRPALLGAIEDTDLDYVVDLHLRAAIHIAEAMLPAMEAAGNGRIVLIGSRGALGLQTRTVYAATKAAMVGMGRTWALELAPKGITVNIVSPGPIESDMFHALIPENSDKKLQVARSIPVGRIGRPEDVAHAVRFFLDPAASFVTGQNLLVCGGASIGSITL